MTQVPWRVSSSICHIRSLQFVVVHARKPTVLQISARMVFLLNTLPVCSMWLHTCPSAISPCRRIRLACGRYINVSQARSSGSCRNGLIVIEGFGTSLPSVFFRLCHLIQIYNAHSWLCLYSRGWKWRLCKHLHRTRIQSNSYSSSLDTDVPVHTLSFPARIQCSTFAFRILDWG